MNNFIKKLTFRKAFNILLVYKDFYKSRFFGTVKRNAFPLSLSIEPTTNCNLRCPECPSGQRKFTRPTGSINIFFFKKIIDEFSPYLSNLILYFQGEPYLHPDFMELIAYASLEKNIYTTTSTNGHFIDEKNAKKTVKSGLDKLIISLDGITQEIYEQYRVGGKLEIVKKSIENIILQKKKNKSKTPIVVLQFLVTGLNEHQIPELKRYAKKIGADKVELKTIQIYDFKNGSELIPSNENFSRYKKLSDGTYEIKNKLRNNCSRLWNSSVITWDGDVLPCCFDKDAKYKFGNLNKQTFRQINNSRKYMDFRNLILKGRKNIDICRNCTEGLKLNEHIL